MNSCRIRSRSMRCDDRGTAQRSPRVWSGSRGHAAAPARGGDGIRLYLASAPHGDVEAVAAILETSHGFTRQTLAPAAGGPCASTAAERSDRLAPVAQMRGRVVVDGVICAEEAQALRDLGFVGVVVASTRTPAVCALTAPDGCPRAWGARSADRRPVDPGCGGGVPPAEYLLDTGRDGRMAREHIGTLVAVVETLICLERAPRPALEGAAP